MSKKSIILVTCCLLSFSPVFSQHEFSLNILGGIPTQEFRDVAPDMFGLGLSGNFAIQAGESPFHFGVDVGYMIYGKDRETQLVFVDGFEEEADFVRNNNIWMGHFLVRVKPDIPFPIKPYFDGLVGGKYIYTRTILSIDEYDEPFETNTEISDWAWSYGGAVGVRIALGSSIFLDSRVVYLRGGQAEYLKPNSVSFDEVTEELVFDVFESRTDMFLPQIGVTAEF